ncbi:MAG: DUF4132 domain-containing protein, partial [Zoogloeaceae bacterium]|nr:DUF4132 domain-containing protein [Zoogloeaceae bacterium]
MNEEAIIEKLNQQTGRPGAVARALVAWRQSNWQAQGQTREALSRLLLEGAPSSCAAMFDNGPRPLFAALHGPAVADWAGKVAERLTLYVHSPSAYRRSFRTAAVEPYLSRFIDILEVLFFSWEDFDLARDLARPWGDRYDDRLGSSFFLYGDFLAARIDEGDEAVIAAVKDILLGGNNTLLSEAIINGVVKSANRELLDLLTGLLLAAKLQEGLRQSILENADNGRVEALIHLIAVVRDNDLLRYSSAIRAVGVWMGWVETFEDKRVAAKLLALGHDYLTGAKSPAQGVSSVDVTEIYAALWAASVREMEDARSLIDQLMRGEKYQKLVALYFLRQLENNALQSAIAAQFLEETDLDVLALVTGNYLSSFFNSYDEKAFSVDCQKYAILADRAGRERQFAALLNLIPRVPPKGYSSQGKPFPWCELTLTSGDLFARLLTIAGYDFDADKVARLLGHISQADPESRAAFIRFFLQDPENATHRAFVFAALNDKSMKVRSQALENVLTFSKTSVLDAKEEKLLIDLLALKTGDLRQNTLTILLGLPQQRPLDAARTLLADKNENRRLAGLDLLTRLVEQSKVERSAAATCLTLMPAISDKEQVLIDALDKSASRHTEANGFGLYDPDYLPDFSPLAADDEYGQARIFDFSLERMTKIFDALRARIRENRDYTYKLHNYDGDEEVALGSLEWPRSRAEVQADRNLNQFESFVLQDVWRDWMKDNGVRFHEVFLFMFMVKMEDYDDRYQPDYPQWANRIIGKFFHAEEIDRFIVHCHKQEYGELAMRIINILRTEYTEDERFAVISGALAALMKNVAAEDWKQPIHEEENYYRSKDDTLADTEEVKLLLDALEEAAKTDEHFKIRTAFCFTLGRLSGKLYHGMDAVDIARAVNLGILEIDLLYRAMFFGNGYLRSYAGKVGADYCKEAIAKYPLLKKTADEVAARVIEIELQRGDSTTEVSHLASALDWHEGAETFAKILVALGKETFVRGYIYGNDLTKKSVLSNLLKSSHPKADDDAATLRAALAGKKIADKRLIEAAMYAPAWIGIVGDHLGWPGFKSAAWYFHAHINESFSAEKETEIARYSPITPQAFNDGAFDIDWFKDAHATLGEERFAQLYDSAKYLTSGANHRRAQLFADAVLGRFDAAALWQEVHEKRNKDKLLSYSLIPLQNGEEEALARYENIQLFLKESKTFGAQRRESEGKAVAIALENLARNAGFADTLRFSWRMETLKIDSVKVYFDNRAIGAYQLRVALAEDGNAALVCEKDGKKLASLPAALKKDPYVLACKETAAALKAQHQRARENLERIMINRDRFSFGELKALMAHPVVAPLLARLILVRLGEDGQPTASGGFHDFAGPDVGQDAGPDDDVGMRIAHPFDLYTLGSWQAHQRAAFEQRLVQPFKQIFRELYLINEDERAAGHVSRRYAGHQVQPKKTVALLKGRQWTVDYEEGLQRVYYRENLYVKLQAAADWFSPADIEAPTLESVTFCDRKTHQPVLLADIPPVIFSEVMRDIDLVVSVAHVGGVDPEASHSTVVMRAVLVEELLRLLHIDNVGIAGRHAKIVGKLGEYTVHLGSAQAYKMGRGAINILAVPSQHRGRLFLPFADDDPRTAEVLSKILLLAEDEKIQDPAILRQIGLQ